MEDCIRDGVSFTQETSLSGHRPKAAVQSAKEAGYYIRLYYIGLDTADESKRHIANRVASGGHNIASEAVERRFLGRLEAVRVVLPFCDEATFYDNNNGFVEVAAYRNGELILEGEVDDYMHKASRYVIDCYKEHDVSKIIIGKNINWKQDVCLGRRNTDVARQNDQNFVSIPHARFIDMLSYKAEECGITVITVEEKYTSGTSAIDDELPEKVNYDKSKRIHRGMFRSNAGICINADLNAAYQMMKKVVPFQWDRGYVHHPVMVNMV